MPAQSPQVEMWQRRIEVRTALKDGPMWGVELTSPPWEIHFRVNFDSSEDADTATVTIHNMRGATSKHFAKGNKLYLAAGYEWFEGTRDVGTVMVGEIKNVHEYWDDTERVTEIDIADTTNEFLSTRVKRTWPAGTTGHTALRDVLVLTGLEVGNIRLPVLKRYEQGRTVDGTLREVAQELAKDNGAKIYIRHGAIFAVPPDATARQGPLLKPDTGLISRPTRVDEEDGDWAIECLLNYRIRAYGRVEIRTATGPGASTESHGVYRVVKGSHVATGSDFTTQFTAAVNLSPPPLAEQGGESDFTGLGGPGGANCGEAITWVPRRPSGGGPIPGWIPRGGRFSLQCATTGIKAQMRRLGGWAHMDVEPLTRSDADRLNGTPGGRSWNHRPIFVFAGGKTIAASMNYRPHGSSAIGNNGFPGHHCIHFAGSRGHGSGVAHPKAQSNVRSITCR